MKLGLLVDFNNLCFRIFFSKDVGAYTQNPDYNLWKYMVFNNIYNFLQKEQGINEVVLAVDDKNSWRKSYFPRYKESRKKKRDKTEVNFEELYNAINELSKELKHYMPFKIIRVGAAEADDVIAAIALNNIMSDFIVLSNDEDYLQLSSGRVRIYNPGHNEYSICENPEEFVIKKCLQGQAKDDIFNVKTPSDWGLTEETKDKRKPGFGPKSAEKVIATGDVDKWLRTNKDACNNKDLEKHFHRNRVLIDFNKIPQTIIGRIMEVYMNHNFPPPENIYQFFKTNNFRGFLDKFNKVEGRLLKLY